MMGMGGHERAVLVQRLMTLKFAAGEDEPRPTAAETANASLLDLGFELIEAAEVALMSEARAPPGRAAPGPRISQNIAVVGVAAAVVEDGLAMLRGRP